MRLKCRAGTPMPNSNFSKLPNSRVLQLSKLRVPSSWGCARGRLSYSTRKADEAIRSAFGVLKPRRHAALRSRDGCCRSFPLCLLLVLVRVDGMCRSTSRVDSSGRLGDHLSTNAQCPVGRPIRDVVSLGGVCLVHGLESHYEKNPSQSLHA